MWLVSSKPFKAVRSSGGTGSGGMEEVGRELAFKKIYIALRKPSEATEGSELGKWHGHFMLPKGSTAERVLAWGKSSGTSRPNQRLSESSKQEYMGTTTVGGEK